MTNKESLEKYMAFRDALISEYEVSANLMNEIDHSTSAIVPVMELQRHLIRALGAIDIIIMMMHSKQDSEEKEADK